MAEQSASGIFTVAVEGYGSNLLHNLNDARLKGRFYDIKIQIGEHIIHAHKLVLSEGCEYFRKILCRPVKEADEGFVKIEDMDFECLETCVKFIYLGQAEILKDNLIPLLEVANKLELKELCEAAGKNLAANLSLESFFIAKSVANSLDLKRLGELCDEFALENLSKIAQQDDFVEIDAEYLKLLMDAKVAPALKCKIFLSWAKHRSMKRGVHFEEFFVNIEMSELPSFYVKFLLQNEALFYESAKCLGKYLEWKLQSAACGDVDLCGLQKVEVKKFSGFAVFDKTSNAIQAYNPDEETWTEIHKMPPEICAEDSVVDFTASLVGDEIFVFAKDRRNWKLRYSDENAKWISIAKRSITRTVNSVEISGRIYAFDETDKESKAVELYDGSSWTYVTDKKHAGYETHIIAVEDSIYCMGGYTGNSSYSECYKYETGMERWTSLRPMPEKRSCGGVAELDRKIYIIGGYCKISATTTGLVFDIGTGNWTKISNSMSQQRHDFRAIPIAGKIYCIGGDSHNFSGNNDVEVFDTATGNWKLLSILPGKSIVNRASIPL